MLKNAEKTEIAELSREISDYAKKLRALGRNPKKADLFLIDVLLSYPEESGIEHLREKWAELREEMKTVTVN
ncbi:unknown [Acetobacter sp. CAG:977]|nr:unknown [Acetobacter sp. CAG:977]